MTGFLSIAFFLSGCAGTTSTATHQDKPASQGPDQDQDIIVGQGTTQDRSVIDATDQRIFDAEHAESPAGISAAPTPVPPQGANSH